MENCSVIGFHPRVICFGCVWVLFWKWENACFVRAWKLQRFHPKDSLYHLEKSFSPANELKITSIIGLVSCNSIPTKIPKGVASAKIDRSKIPFFRSSYVLKFFVMLIPSERAAAGLCKMSASMILIVAANSLVNPKAIPSKMACIERAITKTRL